MQKILNKIFDKQRHKSDRFFLIAGPCIIENKEMGFEIAEKVKAITDQFNIPYIFKASYRKANRSRLDSFTGIGDELALVTMNEIGKKYNLPVLTDIHSQDEATQAANHTDILQIPAFLCRQTDLLISAGQTGKVVNIKKGQFLSADAMRYAVDKIESTGNKNIIITERGNSFGYGDLVVDFRGIPTMQKFGYPVVLDVTHSLQQPNRAEGVTGGFPELIETISKAGIATGVDGLFIETHPDPSKAKSDGANMLKLDKLEELLEKLVRIREAIKA